MGVKPRPYLKPLSWPFAAITAVRNWAFDKGFLVSTRFTTPILSVGNLSTGGTGKTPMVSYLLEHSKGKVAVLSRGYGRKTKGFIEVECFHKAEEVGDEPLEQKKRFPEATIAVCEDRVAGVTELIRLYPNLSGIILDDAFQHRYLKPDSSLLLTPYDQLFTRDYVVPAGNLRESVSGANRATAIIVTKCPEELSRNKKKEIQTELWNKAPLPVFFSRIVYTPNPKIEPNKKYLLVTGIENPKPLASFLESRFVDFISMAFGDHHSFSPSDIDLIESTVKENEVSGIITTAKDFTRLEPLHKESFPPLLVQEITTELLHPEALFEQLEFPPLKTH